MKKIMIFISLFLIISSSLFCDGPAAVNLGTSGNYAILAKTGISTTGSTEILGDIGVSPNAATSITGFNLIMHSSGTYSNSSLIVGKVYAADYTSPTPSTLTTAVGDMETAYTDAAGRPDPDFTELYTGDLTGKTVVPGLYKWSSGVLISAGGLNIAGTDEDVWIFQIAQNLTVENGAIINLSGGAQPQNIFWQVAGQTTIGTTAEFKGIILCQTLISLNTDATITGRLLAQTAVTLNGNRVLEPLVEDPPLPVTLSHFTAISQNGISTLVWQTESESNNSHWNVYRSNSEDIGQSVKVNSVAIAGAGTTSEQSNYEFTDEVAIEFNSSYWYWLESVSLAGNSEFFGPTELIIYDPDNPETPEVPEQYNLKQNYPNPFNPETNIAYDIKQAGNVTIEVFNMKGQKVRTLVDENKEAGTHTVEWNGVDDNNQSISSGIYFYKMKAADKYTSVKKMILLK
jgi:hypothetical protein